MELKYKGQEIGLIGSNTAKIFDKSKRKWIKFVEIIIGEDSFDNSSAIFSASFSEIPPTTNGRTLLYPNFCRNGI